MIDLLHQSRFPKAKSNFKRKLNEDVKARKSSNKTLALADKTSNVYKLTKDQYNHLLGNAVTATYKKATKGIKDIINKEGIKHSKRAGIFDRIEINCTNNCFITLKDHKENFVNFMMTDCQFLETLVDNKQKNKKILQKILKDKALQIII